jgi:alkanesulfonate monooxygenase SsuD/methylene tetrahydromethanopterin reductase-like flavin-dependent oxidoreductase (luciferase family)
MTSSRDRDGPAPGGDPSSGIRQTGTGSGRFTFGVQPLTYGLTWAESVAAAQLVDQLGYDYLWGHDHLYSTGGDPFQPFFEGWTTLAAWAALTTNVRLGLLVGANPFRNPGIVAKMAATVDHLSAGRFVLGLGAGNREDEAIAHGIDPGRTVGQRLDWLDESLGIVRSLLDGREVTHHSDRYQFESVRHAPGPIQNHVPVVVGAAGERKGLRIVAGHADVWQMWLAPDDLDLFGRKDGVLVEHCGAMGRDPATIERVIGGKLVIRADPTEARRVFEEEVRVHRWSGPMLATTWTGTAQQIADAIIKYRSRGATGFSASVAAPLDLETIERLAAEVRPIVEAAG